MTLPSLNEVKIFVKTPVLNNLKILHLSDLHINKKTDKNSLEKLVLLCNNSDANFIVITGDIIDCKIKQIEDKVKILNKLSKRTFYISGNHDLFYGLDDLKNCLVNLEYLDNKNSTFYYEENELNIVGLSDRFSKFFGQKREEKKSNYPT